MARAVADIEFTTHENDRGFAQDCVIATCTEADFKSEPVWGHGYRSVRRALIQLSTDCPCGARYHAAADGEDQEDYDDV